MGGKYSEAQNKATQRYIKNNYDTITVRMLKGKKDEYSELAKKKGVSLTRLILDLLDRELTLHT